MSPFVPRQAVRLRHRSLPVTVTAVPRSTAVAEVTWSDAWHLLGTVRRSGDLAVDAGTLATYGHDIYVLSVDHLNSWEVVG